MAALIIKLLLSLASSAVQYANTKKLMDAGAAEAAIKGIQDAQDAIARADAARARGMRDDFKDPFDTNNQ